MEELLLLNNYNDKEIIKNKEKKLINDMIKIRESKNISQKHLSDLVEVSQPSLARLEKNKISPGIGTMIKLLAPLGYTIDIVPIRKI